MKKFFTILAVLLTIIAGVIFAGNKITAKNEESLRIMELSNAPGLTSDNKAIKPLEQLLSSDKEWIASKNVSELKFSDIELKIYVLKAKMETPEAISDVNCMKKIVNLEERVRYEKARLSAFEKNPVNWESFKPGFLYEINAISKTVDELCSSGETAVTESGIKVSN